MTQDPSLSPLSTVSRAFLEDWLVSLRSHCPPDHLAGWLEEIGLAADAHPRARVTHDQIVRLYQRVAIGTGDEMMGLWSRPIRAGALKLLCSSVRDASSLTAALFRFTQFWNLLLDDFTLELLRETQGDRAVLRIALTPRGAQAPQRFGHMLLLKLVHGIASWLTGRELPLSDVGFAFDRPDFAEDYPILFPAAVRFGQARSSIALAARLGDLPVSRSDAEMDSFLRSAPEGWIFTGLQSHALSLSLRGLLLRPDGMADQLGNIAASLGMTPRTLIRRLAAEGTSFQSIKDGLRRDLAIRDLAAGKSIDAIAQDTGFASTANFHRAFKHWTGTTPARYRRTLLARPDRQNTA